MDNLTLERLQRLHAAACGLSVFPEILNGFDAACFDDRSPVHHGSDSDTPDDELHAPFAWDSSGWVYGFEPKPCLRPSTHCGSRACADNPFFEYGDNKSKEPVDFGYDVKERPTGRNATFADEQKWASRHGSAAKNVSVSSSLKDLDKIYIMEMENGQAYRGRALFGTICKPPKVVDGMLLMSIKDKFGEVIDATMHFSPVDAMEIKEAYTVGKHVAIKHPCVWEREDGIPNIVIWKSCDSIEFVGKLPTVTPTTSLDDVQTHAVLERWDLALQDLTRCIEMVKSEFTASSQPSKAKVLELSTILVHCYSARAKIFYNTFCFEEAMNECNEALKIDRYHCKSLLRKALAYEGLFRFEDACIYLEDASNRNRGQGKTKRKKKIRAILRSCRSCCSQNQNGKYANLARYLLHNYNPGKCGVELPSFVNDVGHVQVKLLRKGKARGLFATRDIKAGDVLMVSNAMAICYQSEDVEHNVCVYESLKEKLVSKIESTENLQSALSYLVGSGSTNTSCTTELGAVAESCIRPSTDGEALHLNMDCIREIVRMNAFGPHQFCRLLERHEYVSKYVDARSFLGLWFLPAFINHSCLSNASRLVVGDAMFVHAACDIKEGEEITLPYIDTLMPLQQRRHAMKRWGFSCACKRCTFEQTIQALLSKVTKRFDTVYKWIIKTMEKAVAAKSLRGFGDQCFDFPTSSDYEAIMSELGDVMISTLYPHSDEEKSRWMMASYAVLLWYDVMPMWKRDLSDPGLVIILEDLVEAMRSTAPGHMRSLVLVGNINVTLRQGVLDGPAYAVAKSVFGAQEPHVLAELVRLYGSLVPFP
ncbi:hypothetical protein GOP47_0006742 [Adiantum capillus-veneris]|uniref:SET domain-containing protein n=1 Tax=Adiantum capillus-veneris TaxID=13818 RepID=A0A9D4V471_ADICA|nr:hypothetical protein GOP47_0006742 [Adiantum capillus-veneris]